MKLIPLANRVVVHMQKHGSKTLCGVSLKGASSKSVFWVSSERKEQVTCLRCKESLKKAHRENLTKQLRMMTSRMCRTAYNGNCSLKCKHHIPHRKNDECSKFCERTGLKTQCIEVEFPGGEDYPKSDCQCGKKITKNCKGELQTESKFYRTEIKPTIIKGERFYDGVCNKCGAVAPVLPDEDSKPGDITGVCHECLEEGRKEDRRYSAYKDDK